MKLNRIWSGALGTMLLLSAAACGSEAANIPPAVGGGTQPATAATTLAAATEAVSTEAAASEAAAAEALPDALSNPDLHIIYWRSERNYKTEKVRAPNLFDGVWEAKPLFEEKYGGTVNIEYVEWNSMLARMAELQAAGQAPDLIEVYDRVMHNMIFQGSIMPLSDYVTDSDFAFWDVDRELFSWKGVPYAIPWKPYLTSLVFNRDLLDLYGLEMPDELYKRGEWTFDKFAEMIKTTTRYTDGEAESMGYGSWEGEGMSRLLVANGASFIDVDTVNGTAVSGFDNQAMIDTLDWMRTWSSAPQSAWAKNDTMFDYFEVGNLAFIDGVEYGNNEFAFDIGMVPYPKGPNSAVEKPVVVMPQGMAVPNGAKNPEGAVTFMRMLNENWATAGNELEANLIGQEYFDMIYNDPASEMVYAFDKATENIDRITGTVANLLDGNTPASTIAEQLNPEHKAAIDLIYSGK
ncbi:MAG: extracellular solute-binding protein [Clostridiales bacterium]|jgi:multiple sugar transport system substrate-binding protein|nr:extracellular solute-binding protein [Clostridiales bacterium]